MDEGEAEAAIRAIRAVEQEILEEAQVIGAIRAAVLEEDQPLDEADAQAATRAIEDAEREERLDEADARVAIRVIRAAVQKERLKQGSRYLNTRIQSSSQTVMILSAGMFMPMAMEHSNNKQQQQYQEVVSIHIPAMICTFLTFFCGLSLRGLVGECFPPIPGPRRYIAIKLLVHLCAILLVSLSFALSLMMGGMNVVVTSATPLAAASAFVACRLRQCAATAPSVDVEAYRNCEEQLQQLLDLSTNIMSTLFLGWFTMVFFYFRNYPEEAHDARFIPSEYLTFFFSVAGALMLLMAVRRWCCRCC
ncbi:hypothetical protein HU200_049426 [Digitaria exilis]|uniref:Uncharacterized protein n=1 Tax=Digitaria exilis TaxID=1010633 RepID=A0A835EC86_9POAL|nr:hypothetical protein HU200_049426 [Digitaria exilis]